MSDADDDDFDPNSTFLVAQTTVSLVFATTFSLLIIASVADELGFGRGLFRWLCGTTAGGGTGTGTGTGTGPVPKPAALPYWVRRVTLFPVVPAQLLVAVDLDGARGLVPVSVATFASLALQLGYCIAAAIWLRYTFTGLYRQLATPLPSWLVPVLWASTVVLCVSTVTCTAMALGDLHAFAVASPVANIITCVQGTVLIVMMLYVSLSLRADLRRFLDAANRYAATQKARGGGGGASTGAVEASKVVSAAQPSAQPSVTAASAMRTVAVAPPVAAGAASTSTAAKPASLSVALAVAAPASPTGAASPKTSARPLVSGRDTAPASGGGGGGLSDTRHITAAISRLMLQCCVTLICVSIPLALGFVGGFVESSDADVTGKVHARLYTPSSRRLSLGSLTGWLFQLVGIVPLIICAPPHWHWAFCCSCNPCRRAKPSPFPAVQITAPSAVPSAAAATSTRRVAPAP